MKPLFVRELSDPERHALQVGLRSSDGFTVRRCHILLASARGDTTTVIAQAVGCSPQAVRNVLRAFETRGLAVVAMQSRRPHAAAKLFDAERSEPPRVCRRFLLLRGWSHDEENTSLFT